MPRIIAPGATWELVSTAGKVTAEGVVAAPDGRIYLVDITNKPDYNPGGTLYRFDPTTRTTTKYMEPSGMALGLHFDCHGKMWMCQGGYGGKRALARHDIATKTTVEIANSYRGRRFCGPNDVTSDAEGRIYFTDALFMAPETMELPNAVYRYDPDGTLTQICSDVLRPNGIEISPDGTRLYVAASNSTRLKANQHGPAADRFGLTMGGVVVYDRDRNGNIANGRVFYRNDDVLADGMAMDSDGNLYVALFEADKNVVVALDPDGKVIEDFPLPMKGHTNQLGFGRGAEAHMLYLTTGAPWQLFRIATNRRGHYF